MWGHATANKHGRNYRCRHVGVERCQQKTVNAEVVERQVLELLRWFDIPQHAQEDAAKAVIALCRETGGDDDYIRSEAARRELELRRERVLEMYRDGLCERKFRDRSLQEIAEEERRWEFATTTPGMTPIQALELVRGFAKAIQTSTPEAQREVVQRVLQRIAITDDRVTDVDVYPVYAELSGGIGDPERIRSADPSSTSAASIALGQPVSQLLNRRSRMVMPRVSTGTANGRIFSARGSSRKLPW